MFFRQTPQFQHFHPSLPIRALYIILIAGAVEETIAVLCYNKVPSICCDQVNMRLGQSSRQQASTLTAGFPRTSPGWRTWPSHLVGIKWQILLVARQRYERVPTALMATLSFTSPSHSRRRFAENRLTGQPSLDSDRAATQELWCYRAEAVG